MPKIPIIAYYYHEAEERLIRSYLEETVTTASFIFGFIDVSKIASLKKEGVLVDLLPDAPASEREIPRGAGARSLDAQMPDRAAGEVERAAKPDHYLITLKGPLLESWKKELDERGITILENRQQQVYKVYCPYPLTSAEKPGFVSVVRPFEAADTEVAVKRSLLAGFDVFAPEKERIAIYDMKLEPGTMEAFLDRLAEQGIDVLAHSGNKVRVRLKGTAYLHEYRRMAEVVAVEEYSPPRLHNDAARLLLHLDNDADGNRTLCIPYEGEGQLVGVADTGIDETHPDFEGRIYKVVARGRPDDATDPHGHGTHVAGSVLGSGNASEGLVKGMAPKARLFFQSVLDAEGGLGGLPLNLADLFQEAYDEGVRIHNNSWGSLAESEYLFNSLEVDEFVHRHKDMLIVISAGNEGSAVNPRNSRAGFVDWLSLGAPATAKNALTVGASRSDRQDGGFASLTYGQVWPDVFPDDPIHTARVSGDAECVAGFSSRGPCGNESRIKPDVVAPGSDIASAKSSLAPGSNFWGPYPGNRKYAFMGGTSMAAPIVTGFATLLREYFVRERAHVPSAALLKAAIINSTRMLNGEDALADHQSIPNFHQGFGCIDMAHALPDNLPDGTGLGFIDTWKQEELQLNVTGQRFLFRVEVAEGAPLRLCLAWTDPPGRGLQNNLNLFMMQEDKQFKWTGNEDIPRTITAFDRDNNVEIIRIDDPSAGIYMIAVQAANVIFGPQDFALVVSGRLRSPLEIHKYT